MTKGLILSVVLMTILFTGCKKDSGDNNQVVTPVTAVDADGNNYKLVIISGHYWMAENLRTTHFMNGDPVNTSSPVTKDITLEASPKYQWEYSAKYSAAIYGRLYTWYAATDARKLCPTGWHLPTDAEWTTLETALGGTAAAGGKMKEAGTTHWQGPNTGATNDVAFAALPGGYRNSDGNFSEGGLDAWFWSATETDGITALHHDIDYNSASILRNQNLKPYGASVRCTKD